MSIEPDSPIFRSQSPSSDKENKPQSPLSRETQLATAAMPKGSQPQEPKVRMHVRPIDTTKGPLHEKITTASSSMTPRPQSNLTFLPPLKADASVEEIMQYLAAWVQNDPKNHNIATARQIKAFLGSLTTKTPNTQIRFEQDTYELPDIFHASVFIDHLKALTIRSPQLQHLPESIGSLKNLVVLELRGCTGLTKLFKHIAQLNKLTLVGLGECNGLVKLPQGLLNKSMSDGQTLMTREDADKHFLEIFSILLGKRSSLSLFPFRLNHKAV